MGTMLLKRVRFFSKDYILDIVPAPREGEGFYYIVHSRSTGEIFTLGQESSFEEAQRAVDHTFLRLTGEALAFERVRDQSSVAS